MKAFSALALSLALAPLLRADLTVVQKIEGVGSGLNEITIKLKGDKARVGMPQAVMIIDGKSGDAITLMPAQKQVLRISGERMRAMTEMTKKYAGGDKTTEQKPKLVATGKKEKINGVDTEIYTSETPQMKSTYWIATNYPNGAEILRQLQSMQPAQWNSQQSPVPDFRDFPGLPLKTVVTMKGGNQFTVSLTSIKQDPVPDSEFEAPKDYTEMKMPAIQDPSAIQKAPAQTAPTPSP